MSAYPSESLNHIMHEAGVLFELAGNIRNDYSDIEVFTNHFVKSEVANGIEIQHPHYIEGSTGSEWYIEMLRMDNIHFEIDDFRPVRYLPLNMYWCGWVIAYYQWLRNITFRMILPSGMITDLLQIYELYHEMDISHTVEFLDNHINMSEERAKDFQCVPYWELYASQEK